MSDGRADESQAKPRRWESLPTPIVLALLGLVGAGSGAGGSLVTANTVAGELREFRVEVRGTLETLKAQIAERDRQADSVSRRLDAVIEKVHKIELDAARAARKE